MVRTKQLLSEWGVRAVAFDSSEIHFDRPEIGVIKITEAVLKIFVQFAQLAPSSKEAGGVLIGRHILHSTDVVVDAVTTPLRGDRRSRTRFHRHAQVHQELLDRAWAETGGTSVYLGEWHTHPEPTPTPSNIDLTDWARRLKSDTLEASFMLFIIVGQRDIRVWEGSRKTLDVHALRPRDASRCK